MFPETVYAVETLPVESLGAEDAAREIGRILDCCQDFPGSVLRLLLPALAARDDLTGPERRACQAAALLLNRSDWAPHRQAS